MRRERRIDFEKRVDKRRVVNGLKWLISGKGDRLEIRIRYGDWISAEMKNGQIELWQEWKRPDSIQIGEDSFMDDEGADKLTSFKASQINHIASYIMSYVRSRKK